METSGKKPLRFRDLTLAAPQANPASASGRVYTTAFFRYSLHASKIVHSAVRNVLPRCRGDRQSQRKPSQQSSLTFWPIVATATVCISTFDSAPSRPMDLVLECRSFQTDRGKGRSEGLLHRLGKAVIFSRVVYQLLGKVLGSLPLKQRGIMGWLWWLWLCLRNALNKITVDSCFTSTPCG